MAKEYQLKIWMQTKKNYLFHYKSNLIELSSRLNLIKLTTVINEYTKIETKNKIIKKFELLF